MTTQTPCNTCTRRTLAYTADPCAPCVAQINNPDASARWPEYQYRGTSAAQPDTSAPARQPMRTGATVADRCTLCGDPMINQDGCRHCSNPACEANLKCG